MLIWQSKFWENGFTCNLFFKKKKTLEKAWDMIKVNNKDK